MDLCKGGKKKIQINAPRAEFVLITVNIVTAYQKGDVAMTFTTSIAKHAAEIYSLSRRNCAVRKTQIYCRDFVRRHSSSRYVLLPSISRSPVTLNCANFVLSLFYTYRCRNSMDWCTNGERCPIRHDACRRDGPGFISSSVGDHDDPGRSHCIVLAHTGRPCRA